MPPVPELQRKCVKHYQSTTGLMIEPGVRVIIPVYAIHWDPNHYPEPEKFIPERFSQGNEHRRERYTYLPFGDGPRSCIGELIPYDVLMKNLDCLQSYNIKTQKNADSSFPI
ncbi:hypothetical protein AAG570_004177 [Ranatra chinensis]|uniref:Cytochrome P450 n=1 Tax=Ranatra chinensis TaxID=642074 RepID=A0ABD0Y336_9HEMI